ncbi:MAG TPA: hypothetical protein VHW90_09505 [Stellaceae bacterium]|nr:hypothetical protein [Stellaceae bacterium]
MPNTPKSTERKPAKDADKLTQTTKKDDVELKEDDLKRVTGGLKIDFKYT